MSFQLGDLFWNTSVIQDYVDDFCRKQPDYCDLQEECLELQEEFFDGLSPEQRKSYLRLEAVSNACTCLSIQGTFYAGLGLRKSVLDAMGASDHGTSDRQARS